MSKYGVIFDMDGVLVDSYHAHFESWRDAAAEEGVELSEAEFARSFGRTSREIIRSTWRDAGALTDDRIQAIDARKEAAFRRIIGRDFPVMDGAQALIASLRAAGMAVAVGSSAPPENVDLVLGRFGGRQRFDAVVTGMDVRRGKPDPQVFLLTAERADIEPRNTVVVEDAPPGIEAAHRAGMAAVALLSTGRTPEDFLPVRPDLVVRSLRELTPARLRDLIAARQAV